MIVNFSSVSRMCSSGISYYIVVLVVQSFHSKNQVSIFAWVWTWNLMWHCGLMWKKHGWRSEHEECWIVKKIEKTCRIDVCKPDHLRCKECLSGSRPILGMVEFPQFFFPWHKGLSSKFRFFMFYVFYVYTSCNASICSNKDGQAYH